MFQTGVKNTIQTIKSVMPPAGTTASETTFRLAPGEERIVQVFTTLVVAASPSSRTRARVAL